MIGELYDVNNVVVGQAAVLFAPNGTALPDFSALDMTDPFDLNYWESWTLTVGSGVTGYTLTDANGNVTSSLVTASTGSQIAAALNALDPNIVYTVVGSSSPFTITASEYTTLTASTFTGGTGSLTSPLWVATGATDQGWTYGTDKSTQQIQIEEQSTPASEAITTQSVSITGSLSEDISKTLTLAYNATLTHNAATSSEPAYDDIALTDTVLYYAVAMISQNFNGFPRIIYAPKWSQLSNVSTAYRRAAAERMYPVGFQTLCKPGQIHVYNFTAVKT